MLTWHRRISEKERETDIFSLPRAKSLPIDLSAD